MNKKTIWITGASSGIGEASARKFAKEGWKVIISARRVELLEKLSTDENIFSYPLDVTDSVKAKEVFKKIIEDHGQVDLCIFSSGTYERKSEKELDVKNIRHVIEVNFLGVINCVSAVEKYYKDKNNGHIAIVSSPVGYRGLPKSSGYTPSKAALNNFTQGIYFDFKKFNVKVSLITPGFIKTAMTDKIDEKYKETIISKIPSARLGEPDDIANAVGFLCSDKSSYINGETLHVNGGMYMA